MRIKFTKRTQKPTSFASNLRYWEKDEVADINGKVACDYLMDGDAISAPPETSTEDKLEIRE